MTIADIGRVASPPRMVRWDNAAAPQPARAARTAAPFGPAVTISLSTGSAGPIAPGGGETLQDFKAVATAAKQDIADAARRLQAANPQDAEEAERARAALDRELAELSHVVIDGIRASEGADLLAVSIGADAIARPLAVNIVV